MSPSSSREASHVTGLSTNAKTTNPRDFTEANMTTTEEEHTYTCRMSLQGPPYLLTIANKRMSITHIENQKTVFDLPLSAITGTRINRVLQHIAISVPLRQQTPFALSLYTRSCEDIQKQLSSVQNDILQRRMAIIQTVTGLKESIEASIPTIRQNLSRQISCQEELKEILVPFAYLLKNVRDLSAFDYSRNTRDIRCILPRLLSMGKNMKGPIVQMKAGSFESQRELLQLAEDIAKTCEEFLNLVTEDTDRRTASIERENSRPISV